MKVSAVTPPSVEPFFVAQTAEAEHLAAPHLWQQAQLETADLSRAGWQRLTIRYQAPRCLLLEIWEQRPAGDVEPQYAFSAAPEGEGVWPL